MTINPYASDPSTLLKQTGYGGLDPSMMMMMFMGPQALLPLMMMSQLGGGQSEGAAAAQASEEQGGGFLASLKAMFGGTMAGVWGPGGMDMYSPYQACFNWNQMKMAMGNAVMTPYNLARL